MIFSGDNAITAPEEIFEERVLEDELNVQLNLLQDQFPDPYLFPQVVEKQADDLKESLPHLKDGIPSVEKVKEEQNIALFEEMAEEGVFESLAICGIIGLLMMAPQFM
jgi:hypothetical protein